MPPRKKESVVLNENAEVYALLEQKVIAFLLLGHYQSAIAFGFDISLCQFDYSKKVVECIQRHISTAPKYNYVDILPQVKQVLEKESQLADNIFAFVVEMESNYKTQATFIDADIKQAITRLREFCARNDLGVLSKKIETLLLEGYDAEYIHEKIRDMLDASIKKFATCAFDNLESLSVKLHKDNDRRDRGEGVIFSGFPDIDKAVNGFNYGEITTIAGETSFGKSALAIKLAHTMSNTDNVGYITFEMPQADIVRRFYAIDLKLPIRELQTNKTEYVAQILARKKFNDRKFFCTEGEHATLGVMESIIRQMVLNKGIKIIFIDHLHCIESGFQKKEHESITLIMRRLKMLAVELNIHIFLLAQLNRANAMRDDKRPQLSDLKESSSIEQYSAEVIMIHRPERTKLNKKYYALENANTPEKRAEAQSELDTQLQAVSDGEECELILAKNRNGYCTRQKSWFYAIRAEYLPHKDNPAEQIFDYTPSEEKVEVVTI